MFFIIVIPVKKKENKEMNLYIKDSVKTLQIYAVAFNVN